MSVHQSLLWRQWSQEVTLFRHTAPEPDKEQARQLAARGVTVVNQKVTEVGDDGVRLADGTVLARDALVVVTRLQAHGVAGLGLPIEEHPMGIGTFVPAEDPSGRTAVPGVWVAGNVTDPMAQVITSAAAGLGAGAAINMDLVTEDAANAVAESTSNGTARAEIAASRSERD
jgi:thioredoxin reductase